MASNNSTFSVIGADVVIRGDVTASADLHVDGKVEGDIVCASIVQGEGSEIVGGVEAESARLAGVVRGTIKARDLAVLKSAQIDGNVHYDSLTIEQGAVVQGNLTQTDAAPIAATTTTATDSTGEDAPHISLAG